MSNVIPARYETRLPSSQTAVDIFKGTWKSKLPGGLESGDAPMFEDTRPAWFNSVFPVLGNSILELGPFEGYQTLALHRMGAGKIVSVEGNTINYLKCLVRKEIDNINVSLKLGDVMKELAIPVRYNVVFASGILYHMQDPVDFIDLCCQRTNAVYVWTHYYDEGLMVGLSPDQKRLFHKDQNQTKHGITHYARRYGIENYEDNIPLYWEGAPHELTYWLEWAAIEKLFIDRGFKIVTHHMGHMAGLPVASFAAIKRNDE